MYSLVFLLYAGEFIYISVYCAVLWVGIHLVGSCKMKCTHKIVLQVMTNNKEIKINSFNIALSWN